MTKSVTRAALAALSLAAIGGPAAAQDWKPGGPINIIVPWGAGGSTDQVTRVTAPILAEALGVSVVVVNQPGASGAIGTQAVLDAPRDGLTWTANAIANNATYQVSGLLEDTDIDDWHIYLSVANAPLISVPADSEFQDFGQLLEAFRDPRRRDHRRDRRRHLLGRHRDRHARPGRRLRVPHGRLRRRRPGGDRHRRRRGDGDDPARRRADRARARRPAAAARGDERPAADRRGRRPGAADHRVDRHAAGARLLRHLHPARRARRGGRDRRPDLGRAGDELRGRSRPTPRPSARSSIPSYGDDARAKAMPIVIQEACSAVERGEAVNPPSVIGVDCETMSEVTTQ